MAIITVDREKYEKMKNHPIYFFTLQKEWDHEKIIEYWKPEYDYLDRIDYKDLESNVDTILTYARLENTDQISNSDYRISVSIELFDPKNTDHIKALFSLCISNHNGLDEYYFRELLWVFNYYIVDIKTIYNVLTNPDTQIFKNEILDIIYQISMCLSIPKQRLLINTLLKDYPNSRIHVPNCLLEATRILYPESKIESNYNSNIFVLTDIVTSKSEYNHEYISYDKIRNENPDNFFIKIRRWLDDTKYSFDEYNHLMEYLRLYSIEDQMRILKRYFHAIRLGQCKLDISFLESFSKNKYDKLAKYRYVLFELFNPINLSVHLLSDSILTFIKTDFERLQTINGVLDSSYSSGLFSPDKNIEFGLQSFLPLCNGGALPNPDFQGFVYLRYLYGIKSSILSADIINLLDEICDRVYICYENTLKNDQCSFLKNCGKSIKLEKWTINKNTSIDILNILLRDDAIDRIKHNPSKDLDLSDIENNNQQIIDKLQYFLASNCNTENVDGRNVWASVENKSYKRLFELFCEPCFINIEPRSDIYLRGNNIILRIEDIDTKASSGSIMDKYLSENSLLSKNVIQYLRNEFDYIYTNERYFIQYTVENIEKIRTIFLVKSVTPNTRVFKDNVSPYLTNQIPRYEFFCAPKQSEAIDPIIQLGYCFCNGKNCYSNRLYDQVLRACNNYERYTLYHLLEILGKPQISQNSSGYVSSRLIQDFIGIVNKSKRIIQRARCRNCNHILFPTNNKHRFNQYNNFSCKLPTCPEQNKRIYLNFCHKCKGVIDSRDSKNCPNGWTICQTCLSCCDNVAIKRSIERYSFRQLNIPEFIKAQYNRGHNDKKLFFCPNCGKQVRIGYSDSYKKEVLYCCDCDKEYPFALNYHRMKMIKLEETHIDKSYVGAHLLKDVNDGDKVIIKSIKTDDRDFAISLKKSDS